MTELEMAVKLGILPEPEKNRVGVGLCELEMTCLTQIFQIAKSQKDTIGTVNPHLWCEFLPWHSLN